MRVSMTKRVIEFGDCDDHFTPMVMKLPEVMCQTILIGYVEAHLQATYRGTACLMISKQLNGLLLANRDMMCAMLDLDQEYWCSTRNIAFYKELIVNWAHFFDTHKRRELMKNSLRHLLYYHTDTKLLNYIYRQSVVLHLGRYLEHGGWSGSKYEIIMDHVMGPCHCIQCQEKYFTINVDWYALSIS